MKIYVCSSYLDNDELKNSLNKRFDKELVKFYGKFDVEVVYQNKEVVYVMGASKYNDHDDVIRNTIKSCLKLVLSNGTYETEVKLNYGKLNPDFVPQPEDNDGSNKKHNGENGTIKEFDYEKLSLNYQAEEPRYSFDQVMLPKDTLEHIEEAIGVLEVEAKVFDEWGLRSIIPEAASALSFYGPPGTGKTMGAEAIASKMGKKILRATYADIESKFHGEGPKMVKAIFKAAERDDAVLFLDESDSLLSKRLTTVSDPSSQAINSMRSQLLVSLENFSGVVIFATNLVVNYDKAFLSRLINIEFTMPDKEIRKEIWKNHIKSDKIKIPLADDVDITELADKYEFCGREIKGAVKNACVATALQKRELVTQNDFIKACDRVESETEKAVKAKDHTAINPEKQEALNKAFQKTLDKNKENDNSESTVTKKIDEI